MAENYLRRSGPQQVHLIDAVRAGEHAVHQRQDLASRQRRARRPVAQPDRLVYQPLYAQPLSERRSDQQPGVTDQTLLVEPHPNPIKPPRPGQNVRRVMHHSSEPPDSTPAAANSPTKPCSEGHLRLTPGRNRVRCTVDQSIQAQTDQGLARAIATEPSASSRRRAVGVPNDARGRELQPSSARGGKSDH